MDGGDPVRAPDTIERRPAVRETGSIRPGIFTVRTSAIRRVLVEPVGLQVWIALRQSANK